MQYFGGKAKIAKEIADILNQNISNQAFIEPFCGSCNVLQYINAPNIYAYDVHKPLISMWKNIQNGWIPPKNISEKEYQIAKTLSDEDPLKAFVGFGSSFGGKYFGGYARSPGRTENSRNYALMAYNSALKKKKNMGNKFISFNCDNYSNLYPQNSVIYCDPPYQKTTKFSTGQFNSEEFWNIMRKWSQNNSVYISEYQAPLDFKIIWEKELHANLRTNLRNKKIERLYQYAK